MICVMLRIVFNLSCIANPIFPSTNLDGNNSNDESSTECFIVGVLYTGLLLWSVQGKYCSILSHLPFLFHDMSLDANSGAGTAYPFFTFVFVVHSVFVTIAIWFLPLLDILQWSRYVAVHRQMSKINSYKKKIENTKGGNQKSYDRNYNSQQKQKNDLQNTTQTSTGTTAMMNPVLSVLLLVCYTQAYYYDPYKVNIVLFNPICLSYFHLCVCVHSVFVTIGIWFLPLLDILQWPRYVAVHRQMSKINSYKKKIENTKGGNQKSYTEN
jgi:hypothetical protein